MNEYKGYTLSDITINSDMSLTGKIYHLSEFKETVQSSDPEMLIGKFKYKVDWYIKQQSELVNCQNFANELVELCKKHRVRLSAGISYLYVNDYLLMWCGNGSLTKVDMIDGCKLPDVQIVVD